MSEMIERVERALLAALLEHAGIHSDQVDITPVARAAIEAMREPTDAMVQATCDPPHQWASGGKTYVTAQWQIMIDEALK